MVRFTIEKYSELLYAIQNYLTIPDTKRKRVALNRVYEHDYKYPLFKDAAHKKFNSLGLIAITLYKYPKFILVINSDEFLIEMGNNKKQFKETVNRLNKFLINYRKTK